MKPTMVGSKQKKLGQINFILAWHPVLKYPKIAGCCQQTFEYKPDSNNKKNKKKKDYKKEHLYNSLIFLVLRQF